MSDEKFTPADIHADVHAWVKHAPGLGALDDWLFRAEVDDVAQYVTGWLTYTDGRIKEFREDISYHTVLKLANRFGSALVVLDQWFTAMCDKAGVSIPLFPDRPRRTFK